MARKRAALRRIGWALAIVVLLAMAALVAAWLSRRLLVARGFQYGAGRAGFGEVGVVVERADLSRLDVSNVRLRLGGLEVALDRAGASYTVRRLLRGALTSVEVVGLGLTLDFTAPRRGLLPDAIPDLVERFSTGGELVWPVDALDWKNCRVKLVFPSGTQEFALHGRAVREPDGRVRFEVASRHPGMDLRATAVLRTETWDGEIVLERLSLEPALVVAIARELGLFEAPAGLSFASDRIELSGSMSLNAAEPAAVRARVNAPRIRVSRDGVEAEISTLESSLSWEAAGSATGDLSGTLLAVAGDSAWSLGPLPVDVRLTEGGVSAVLGPAAVAAEKGTGRLLVSARAGIPALGGAAAADMAVEVMEASVAGFAIEPFVIRANGWLDSVHVSATRLALREATPLSLEGLSIAATGLMGTERSIDANVTVVAHAGAVALLPTGLEVREPAVPVEVGNLGVSVKMGPDGPAGTMRLQTSIPRILVAREAMHFAADPGLELTATFDGEGVSVGGAVSVDAIETNHPAHLPGVQAVGAGFEIPRLSFEALRSLAEGVVPADDIALVVSGSVARSEATGGGSLALTHFGETREWSLGATLAIENINGPLGTAVVNAGHLEASIESGRIPDQRVGEWLARFEPVAVFRELLPAASARISVTAAGIEVPETVRAEWVGFSFEKRAMEVGDLPLAAKASATAGIVRAGPEMVEQAEVLVDLSGTLEAVGLDLHAGMMVEGEALRIRAMQEVDVDLDAIAFAGKGTFELEPFKLAHSDIVSRWKPELPGVSLGATFQGSGSVHWSSRGDWDGTARLVLAEGLLVHPGQRLRVEGIGADVRIASLRTLEAPKGQRIGFSRLELGDIELTSGEMRLSARGPRHILVEGASTKVFGGEVSVGPFTLLLPQPDIAVVLKAEGLDVYAVTTQLALFNGTMTGRLRGQLPVGLLAGRPIIGEGFLELDPRFPATFSYPASGTFTVGLANRTVVDKINRLPYELLEEALAGLTIKGMRIDLFRRDLPDTPIRVEFSGESITPRATVPLVIVTNVNGSVAEVINLLLRLATL